MNSVCIILTDNNSINENIILKSYKKIINSKLKKIYFVGDKDIFNKTYKKFNQNSKINFLNIKLKNQR